ncbi:Nicotinate phosphoribosyltransferase [Acidipropionibacterium acidipropionici ATCC 4875]|uniref:Nicotinate phosphoribosyltransferase n=1 Tax=Acidipropionibacterium acidipropionici (strain ATCC 4875 / DSM 20272 / JCM 6432 / NBRC 12425 / NCIMB 8070 / 4) TaxID=1171373 RepID=K7RYS1_ACIA4|nr:nicotinate phosphoribosyltransferase [Acidipropionibacterium acidipropionici]AFV90168.1 Nicotinate phosphoribosyltransferase [Acidipropionibacterium acidipropionici ATCC 4875]
MSTALLTDHYELTMVEAAMRAGTAWRRCVFELFPRRLPEGRRYGVVAGVGRMLEALEEFRFDPAEIAFLTDRGIVSPEMAEWLAGYRFSGSIHGYAEGDLYFPGSPLLTVEGSFAEACILETLLLSIYNHDSAIASAASRMVMLAEGRPIIEMGSRRTHEEAAVAAARAAWITGFGPTSNLAAGMRYGVPTSGTAAHSFTLLHDTEEQAFAAQLETYGDQTTLLVDTYDIEAAVRTGVRLTDGRLGAVRIDSGDLSIVARQVRDLLDDLGATQTRVIVTSDLDEWQIAALRGAPVDGFGVGTSLVTGSGAPTCSFVYKLVARAASDDPDAPLIPVAKKSSHKSTVGGRKYALRRLDPDGTATAEVVGVGQAPRADADDRDLIVPLVLDGATVGAEPLAVARSRHESAMKELPLSGRHISRGDQAIPTIMVHHGSDGSDAVLGGGLDL